MSVLFTVDSMIRGNHIYKAIWDSHLGEELVCRHERNNIHDPFAVAVLKQYWLPVMYSTINCN